MNDGTIYKWDICAHKVRVQFSKGRDHYHLLVCHHIVGMKLSNIGLSKSVLKINKSGFLHKTINNDP